MYKLNISAKNETLDGKEMPHLFLVSAILESHFGMFRGEEEISEREAQLRLNIILGKSGIMPSGDIHKIHQHKLSREVPGAEVALLFFAATHWVGNDLDAIINRATGAVSEFRETTEHLQTLGFNDKFAALLAFANMGTDMFDESSAVVTLEFNLRDCPPIPILLGRLAYEHNSESLLTLAWAEIWHAIKGKLPNRCCLACGTIFIPPPNHPKKSYCNATFCKKQYEIDRHGGLAARREYERQRKIKRDSANPKPAGRPKKVKAGEPHGNKD